MAFRTHIAGLIIIVGCCSLFVARVNAQSNYDKTFYSNGVNRAAPIVGGGMVQTWHGAGPKATSVTLIGRLQQAIKFRYQHASSLSQSALIAGSRGFPIDVNGGTGATASTGWTPAAIAVGQPGHTVASAANATINVQKLQATGPTVNIRAGKTTIQRVALVNSVRTTIQGAATAGAPDENDRDKMHSADSHAAVSLAATQTFRQTDNKPVPTIELYSENAMWGGAQNGDGNRKGRKYGKQTDPVFVSLADLTTGGIIYEPVMNLALEWENAIYEVNASGISFSIVNDDPDSFVSMEFSNESDWVTNPYSYSVTLDQDGLSIDGWLPDATEWQRVDDGETTEWSYTFGSNGPIFDSALVQAPESLLIEGHDYAYGTGALDGAYELAVPSPASLALLSLGALAVTSTRNRWSNMR